MSRRGSGVRRSSVDRIDNSDNWPVAPRRYANYCGPRWNDAALGSLPHPPPIYQLRFTDSDLPGDAIFRTLYRRRRICPSCRIGSVACQISRHACRSNRRVYRRRCRTLYLVGWVNHQAAMRNETRVCSVGTTIHLHFSSLYAGSFDLSGAMPGY